MTAKVKHRHESAASEDSVDVMLDNHGGDTPLTDKIAEMPEQPKRFLCRQTRAWLIHQKELRPPDEGKRDINPALHAIGDPPGLLVETVGEIHHFDDIAEPIIS
jgi:hypothetical protein